jgi:hypothetical protein
MKKILCTIVALAALTACSNAKEQLGLETAPPDEFAVVKRAPLEMPPDYYLRPPSPGQQRPQELKTDEEAKQAVFGAQAVQAEQARSVTEGEAILLQKTGAVNIDPDIRRKVDAETARIAKEEQPTIDKIRGLAGKKVDAPATVVNAKEETERLKDNEREGIPANEGDVPVIEE